jgi:hypothetical protein
LRADELRINKPRGAYDPVPGSAPMPSPPIDHR